MFACSGRVISSNAAAASAPATKLKSGTGLDFRVTCSVKNFLWIAAKKFHDVYIRICMDYSATLFSVPRSRVLDSGKRRPVVKFSNFQNQKSVF